MTQVFYATSEDLQQSDGHLYCDPKPGLHKFLAIPSQPLTYKFTPDDDQDFPWNNSDGHGPVRRASSIPKRPGERPFRKSHYYDCQYYYDWQEACKIAERDGWNTEPYDAPNRVERAVKSDFDFLQAYLLGYWEYVTIEIYDGRVCVDTLSGVETWKDYHIQCAEDLIKEYMR